MSRSAPTRSTRRTDASRLHVFVPGIMGVGLLVSLAVLLLDGVRRVTSGRTHERHAQIAASRIVAEVHAAAGAAEPASPVGQRHRWVYGAVAAALLSLGLYSMVGSTSNFIFQEWVRHVAWVWAASTVAGVSLVWVGVCAAALLIWREDPPAFVHPLLRRTPLGDVGDRRDAG
jgi:hypothetical protein